MISVEHTPGLPQILLSSEVFQMAEYNYTKPSELLDHDYACSPHEESSIITIHKGSEDEDKDYGQKMVKNTKLSRKRKIEESSIITILKGSEDKENGQEMVKNAKLSKKRKMEAPKNSQENEIVPDIKKPKLKTSLLKNPRLTIGSICTLAFKYFPSGVGTADDIYQFFGFIFPYYKNDPKGNWKNSVRHHLTLKRSLFIKSDEMGKKSGTKAAHYWLMNPAYAEMSNKKLLEDFKQKKKHVLADTNVPDYLENLVNRPMNVAQLIPVINDKVSSVDEALVAAKPAFNSTTAAQDEDKENGQKMVKNAKLSKKRKIEALKNSQENEIVLAAQEFQISSTTQVSGTYFISKK